jgi:hypothetical protein
MLVPGGPLPVPARPLAGEMLASYLRRLAAANHLPVTTLLSALPAWLTWKFASHRLPPRDASPPPRTADSLHRLAALAGIPATSIARTLPLLGGTPHGPARATTACRQCAATHGTTRPVPVHQPAHEITCTRHGTWLPPAGLPQLDVSACPEIITAQHRARRLLHLCTPEQLIYAQVKATELAASGHPPGSQPSPGREQRTQLLRKANPGLSAPAEAELSRAARYPDIIALTAKIITTAAREPGTTQAHAPARNHPGQIHWQDHSRNIPRAGLTGNRNANPFASQSGPPRSGPARRADLFGSGHTSNEKADQMNKIEKITETPLALTVKGS